LGSGTVIGNVTNNGTVSPWDSPGALNVTGNYSQGATGTLDIEISTLASYDRLEITGTADLNGFLDVILLGYTGQANDQFVILSSDGLSGVFSGINFNGSTSSLGSALTFLTLYGTRNCPVNDVCLDVPGVAERCARAFHLDPDRGRARCLLSIRRSPRLSPPQARAVRG
jgi:hypothetical protein